MFIMMTALVCWCDNFYNKFIIRINYEDCFIIIRTSSLYTQLVNDDVAEKLLLKLSF